MYNLVEYFTFCGFLAFLYLQKKQMEGWILMQVRDSWILRMFSREDLAGYITLAIT